MFTFLRFLMKDYFSPLTRDSDKGQRVNMLFIVNGEAEKIYLDFFLIIAFSRY